MQSQKYKNKKLQISTILQRKEKKSVSCKHLQKQSYWCLDLSWIWFPFLEHNFLASQSLQLRGSWEQGFLDMISAVLFPRMVKTLALIVTSITVPTAWNSEIQMLEREPHRLSPWNQNQILWFRRQKTTTKIHWNSA